jgi:hypothetical protein
MATNGKELFTGSGLTPIFNLSIVANIGSETNPDKESNINPLFLIDGLVYSFDEKFDID